MAFVLNVRMTAREGEQDRAAELIKQLAAATEQEPGNVHWIAHRSTENPRTFMIYEQYRDEDAFKAHGQTEHFQRLGPGELFPLMEERRRETYTTT
jgi:quinol monooxygenase YgiN